MTGPEIQRALRNLLMERTDDPDLGLVLALDGEQDALGDGDLHGDASDPIIRGVGGIGVVFRSRTIPCAGSGTPPPSPWGW